MTDELPFSKEVEEAALACILINPDEFTTFALEPTDFYIHRHRMIWETVGALHKRGVNVDFVTLSEELSRRNQLAEVGGPAWLAGLLSAYPYGINVGDTADLIRDYSRRRALSQLGQEIVKVAFNRKEAISVKTAEFIDRLANLSITKAGAIPWASYLSELYDEIEERSKNPKATWGIPTGFAKFDKITGGAQKGESIIFSGKPGVGKSMLAMQIGRNMSEHEPGAIYSIEMKGRQVVRRMVSADTKIQSSRLKSGNIEDSDWIKIAHSIETLGELPVFMSDSVGWTTTALRADLARLRVTHNIGWFIFDYLMLAADAPDLEKTERSEIISRSMKLICRDLDLAGIVVHSMNKAGMDNSRPDQSGLSGSAQVAFDADVICFLTEFKAGDADKFILEKDQRNMRTLFIAKGREIEDPIKYMHLVKLPNLPRFGDYAPEPNMQRPIKGVSDGRKSGAQSYTDH